MYQETGVHKLLRFKCPVSKFVSMMFSRFSSHSLSNTTMDVLNCAYYAFKMDSFIYGRSPAMPALFSYAVLYFMGLPLINYTKIRLRTCLFSCYTCLWTRFCGIHVFYFLQLWTCNVQGDLKFDLSLWSLKLQIPYTRLFVVLLTRLTIAYALLLICSILLHTPRRAALVCPF